MKPKSNMRHRVAIVGTAGRSASEQQRLTREHFEQMCRAVENLLRVWKLSWHEVTLVSGGSAWSDHVAVQLFLRHEHDTHLELFLPCRFSDTTRRFVGNSAASALNKYHTQCSRKLDHSTFDDLATVRALGAVMDTTSRGFFARNAKVARTSDYLVAFTFGQNGPSSRGTLNTWNQFHGTRVHLTLR